MRSNRFNEEQKLMMLREAEKRGVSRETIDKWRGSFDGMDVADIKRLKQLNQEDARLDKLLAEVEILKEIATKTFASVSARRHPVACARRRSVVCRRADALLSVAARRLGYESRPSNGDGAAMSAMREPSACYPR